MSSSTSSTSSGIVERVQTFVSENKKTVLIGSAVAAVAVGGAVYYASTSSGKGGDKKDKKRSSGKKKKTVKDQDGPILEERKPKAASAEDTPAPTPEEVAAMSTEDLAKLAAQYKLKGNQAYQAKKFADAVDLYSQAIAVSPKAEPVFHSNRAACYMNLSPPKYELVVEDCDRALALDAHYLKAMNRRATALEALGRLEEALRDFTASTIFDRFNNKTTSEAVERVLKAVAAKKAAELLQGRQPRLPSFTFINAYFAAFRPRSHPALPDEPSTGDNTLKLALEALDAANYQHALSLVNESLEQGVSNDTLKAEALNLRGTFKFLTADIAGAQADLQTSIDLVPSFTQSLVKIASVYMEQSAPEQAFQCFEDAIKQNANDPDIYYHRGQVLFILNQFKDASDNYTKSKELDDSFVFSHIQHAVAEYKLGNLPKSMVIFRDTMSTFPNRSEPFNYYGELLLDQGRFAEAIEKFDRAIEIEKAKTGVIPNVLSLVNKGLALYQKDQQFGPAEECCAEALSIDPECDAAVATLAQLSMQQGRVDKAVEWFGKQAELARTEPELVAALTYEYASRSQIEFMKNYPEMAAQLSQIASGMQQM